MTKNEFIETKNKILQEIKVCPFEKVVSYDFIIEWIKNNVQNEIWSDKKSSYKKSPSRTTYGLKHVIESELDKNGRVQIYNGYCANNWVKLALIELGFDVCYCHDDSRDWNEEYQNWITKPEYVLDNSVNYIWRVGHENRI